MRVVILNKPTVIDGVQHREGDVVQVADTTKTAPVKLVDNFTEECVKTVLVGKPLTKEVKPKEVQDGKAE